IGASASTAETAAPANMRAMLCFPSWFNSITYLPLSSWVSACRQRHIFGTFCKVAHGIHRHLAQHSEPMLAHALAINAQGTVAHQPRFTCLTIGIAVVFDED